MWIALSKELPEIGLRILVLTDKREIWLSRRMQYRPTTDGHWWWCHDGLHPANAKITHWHTLPEVGELDA